MSSGIVELSLVIAKTEAYAMKYKRLGHEQGSTASMRIEMEQLDSDHAQPLFDRFVQEFVDRKKQESLALALQRRGAKQHPIDYERLLRSDRMVEDTAGTNLLQWLSANGKFPYCYFFQKQSWKPVARMRISSLSEPLATSWPGVFVNFDAGRALVVSLDLDRFRCDIH